MNAALRDVRLRQIHEGAAMRPVGGSAADLGTLLMEDHGRFGRLTKELGFKAE